MKNKRFTTLLLWSSIFLFGLLGLGSWNGRFRFAEERSRVEKQQAVVLLNSLRWQLLELATDVDEPRDWLERAEAIVEAARPEGKVILLNPRFQQWTNWLECGDSQALVICQDSDAGVGRHASWFAIDFSRRVTVCEARD